MLESEGWEEPGEGWGRLEYCDPPHIRLTAESCLALSGTATRGHPLSPKAASLEGYFPKLEGWQGENQESEGVSPMGMKQWGVARHVNHWICN